MENHRIYGHRIYGHRIYGHRIYLEGVLRIVGYVCAPQVKHALVNTLSSRPLPD